MMTADQFRSQFDAVRAGEVVRVDLGDGAVAAFAPEEPATREAKPADPTDADTE